VRFATFREGAPMKIAHFFIDRPVFAIVLSLVALIAGSIALFTLPIAQYPQIAPPTVTVSGTDPGANAETVAKTVATPIEEQRDGIIVTTPSPDITLAVAFFSPDGSHDALSLSNYVTLQVKDQIARLPGVGDINLFGVRDYSMRLWLNPDEMAARNMTASDVVNAVREQNIQVAAGVVGGPPLAKGTSAFQYTLNAQGRLTDPSEFSDIVVKVGS